MWNMLGVVVTAFCMSVVHPSPSLLAIALFSGYMAWMGKRAISRKQFTFSDRIIAVAGMLTSIAMIVGGVYTGSIVIGVFGLLFLGLALTDYVDKLRVNSLPNHIGRMGGALIATCTAVFVVNVQFDPSWVVWLSPSLVGSMCIAYAIKKYTSVSLTSMAFVIAITLLFSGSMHAQTPTQTVKGIIVESKSQQAITGATVRIQNTNMGAVSKNDGSFRITNVPIGRYTLNVKAVGYENFSTAIVLTSGKQVDVRIELTESFVSAQEVTVQGTRGNFVPTNEAAITSANVFSVDDAYRFAGSRSDPARMAQSFAGVRSSNDSRNDIIIRGGSPTELLWRLDGLDIPNPNHWQTQGATGGPISALNINLLANSDFLTGAMPSEYGDKLSGVFDLRTRKGNSEQFEAMGQLGFNGVEAMIEGPMGLQNSSFIVNYRYSFLGFFDKLGIDLGFDGIPQYQDLTLKSDIQLSSSDYLSVTGLWGTSDIALLSSDNKDVTTGDQDILNGTDLGVVSVNWKRLYNENLYGMLTLGAVYNRYRTEVDSVTAANFVTQNTSDIYENKSKESFITAKYRLFYSPSTEHFFTAGIEARKRFADITQRVFTEPFYTDSKGVDIYTVGGTENTWQSLNFINWNWRITPLLTSNLGVHSQYLQISNELSFEPRLALSYTLTESDKLSAGVSLHKQSQPLLLYYSSPENKDIEFSQSLHGVLGYSSLLAEDMLLKLETYYKDYSNIPVDGNKLNAFSMINAGTDFGSIATPENLVNTGSAHSYGAEATFTKNFSNHWYSTITGSWARQFFTASDGVLRNGAFDNRFIFNIYAGYELPINETFTLEFSTKFTYSGGGMFTPINLATSIANNRTEYDDSKAFGARFPDYKRLDFRIDFRNNFNGIAIISYFTCENILNTTNVLNYYFSRTSGSIKQNNQIGFFPIGGVRVEF